MSDLTFEHRFEPSSQVEKTPTLLLLHGTGGNENDLLPLGNTLLHPASLLSPRGKVLENGMPRFFRRLAEGVFDEEDLKQRTNELANFVEEAAMNYGFDKHSVIAVGYSNGANIAASILLLRPGVLRAAVLFRAMVPLQPDALPDLASVPVLLSSGRHDPIVAPTEPERLATMLREAGAAVELHWQNAGHELTNEDIATGRSWLAKIFAYEIASSSRSF